VSFGPGVTQPSVHDRYVMPAHIRRRRWFFLALVVVVAAGAIVFWLTARNPDQAEVGAGTLPTVAGAQQVASFTNCSEDNSLNYVPHNPCETYLLLRGSRYASQTAFLAAEDQRLLAAGWRHTTDRPPVDYDFGDALAPRADSWYSPGHAVCAYVAADRAAVVAAGKGLFPYDHYDDPPSFPTYYRSARARERQRIIWARLRPQGGAC
jgi:hypothetical protein